MTVRPSGAGDNRRDSRLRKFSTSSEPTIVEAGDGKLSTVVRTPSPA
jgi:hypothetical protein